MTEPSEEQIEKFRRVLSAAHRAQSPPPLPPDWRASVMRAVRAQHAARGGDIASAVWRAAAMIAFVSMALIGSAMAWTHLLQPQEDLSLLTAYVVDFSLAGEP
jgi:hypothetical protein